MLIEVSKIPPEGLHLALPAEELDLGNSAGLWEGPASVRAELYFGHSGRGLLIGGTFVGEVALIGVLPQWRGRGLGRELLRWGVAQLLARGAGPIQLTVEAENELALGLYLRTGFEPAVKWPHWTRSVATRATPQAG